MADSKGSPKTACFGEYLAGHYVCIEYCQDRESCQVFRKMLEAKSLAEFPEFLTHSDPMIREQARILVEQLRENDGCNS